MFTLHVKLYDMNKFDIGWGAEKVMTSVFSSRFLQTFKFGSDGQALYLHSPTELQLLSIFTKTG